MSIWGSYSIYGLAYAKICTNENYLLYGISLLKKLADLIVVDTVVITTLNPVNELSTIK